MEPDRTADIQRSYIQTLNSDVNKQKTNSVHSRETLHHPEYLGATQALDGDQW